MRGGPASGKSWKFKDQLVAWVKQEAFRGVYILSATVNPIRRLRDTNRLIPQVFGYLSTNQLKADPKIYETQGLTKFGFWINDSKKKAHQELDELMGGGGIGIFKSFNRSDVPVGLYIIFCSGGIDFVGGYTLSYFIKDNLAANSNPGRLGEVKVPESTGEEIHEKLFTNEEVKTPGYWKQIIQFY